ncbi:bifunctional folylpolyglutamate synthase/dihydrofolate synthase [Maribacter sp. R77961]|uniref:bifunctional folylpolyglutamate synthase/dihydrofolate synthase n=1 Tax=Maribacter sp. R77961 TaxID=3093871 RepID=UPI0037C7FD43
MTYRQTLDWMFVQLPVYQQKGKKAYKAKLDGIKAFASHLNNPQKQFKSIHVAGTNGKGSSSHMLASILQEAGYKVGLYTSPHLKDFRERIRINGKPIRKHKVVEFIATHKSFLIGKQLSFFELTVGMAFDYFSEKQVDIAIIEVGLGGRLDSTNIITPEVSLITNIGYDHTDILGNTLPEIAYEKAGIIKKGVPVVVSEHQPEVASVFEDKSKEVKASLVFATEEDYPTYETDLLGTYQTKNIKGVLATLDLLKGFPISNIHLEEGLLNVSINTGLMGRWQLLSENPKTICDTAHNKDGLALVLNQLKGEKFSKLHIVLGFVKEKDLDSVLSLFPEKAQYYFCKPDIVRGLEASFLQKKALDFKLKGAVYASVKEAYDAAKVNAFASDFIYIGGSTFVVAEVL